MTQTELFMKIEKNWLCQGSNPQVKTTINFMDHPTELYKPKGWITISNIDYHTPKMCLPGVFLPVIHTAQEQYPTKRTLFFENWKQLIASRLQYTISEEIKLRGKLTDLKKPPRLNVQ